MSGERDDVNEKWLRALDEIAAWKSATMLEDGSGDPDGITPAILEDHIMELRRAEADNARLRAILAAIPEWGHDGRRCPVCAGYNPARQWVGDGTWLQVGHRPDCPKRAEE